MNMKQKFTSLMVIGIALMMLTGCGSGVTKAKVGINEISYDTLMKKLNDGDSFFLVTSDVKPQIIEDALFVENFNNALEKNGLIGYYVNVNDRSEEEKKDLQNNYLHPFMDSYGGGSVWDGLNDGLVYVENGGVLSLTNQSYFSEIIVERGDGGSHEINKNVSDVLRLLKQDGFEYEIN